MDFNWIDAITQRSEQAWAISAANLAGETTSQTIYNILLSSKLILYLESLCNLKGGFSIHIPLSIVISCAVLHSPRSERSELVRITRFGNCLDYLGFWTHLPLQLSRFWTIESIGKWGSSLPIRTWWVNRSPTPVCRWKFQYLLLFCQCPDYQRTFDTRRMAFRWLIRENRQQLTTVGILLHNFFSGVDYNTSSFGI